MNNALWFLPCLFVVEILFWRIQKWCAQNKAKIFCALLISGIVGYAGSPLLPFRFPWSMEVALTAVMFYGAGFIFREVITRSVDRVTWKRAAAVLIGFFLAGIFCYLNGRIDMKSNVYHKPVLFCGAAFLDIFSMILLSQMIPSNAVMSFVGRNTLVIMGMEGISSFMLSVIFHAASYLGSSSLHYLESFSLGAALLRSLVQIAVLVPAIWIVNRYFSFILGHKRI